jgi:tryptophan-rich sensory protein
MGGAATATSVDTWYQGLRKPAFNPPDWVFAPVWTALYLMMAVAGWRIWRQCGFKAGRFPLRLFAIQLTLNLAWSFLFFGFQWIGGALVEILILLSAILATMLAFWRLDRAAGALFAPYAAWVAFACALNAAIWRMN